MQRAAGCFRVGYFPGDMENRGKRAENLSCGTACSMCEYSRSGRQHATASFFIPLSLVGCVSFLFPLDSG